MPDAVLSQSWPTGTKVEAVRKTGEFYAGGKVEATAKVSPGEVRFENLEEGRYWAVGEVNGANVVVSFWAKEIPAQKKRTEASKSADLSTHPAVLNREIVTGPKGTKVSGRLVEEPVQKGVEPHPHLNQASIADSVPQRSQTPLGQATPVDPSEPQPKPRQDQVRKGTKQRSDTELGEATPVSDEAGPAKQEDFKGQQRSDTETGEATPIGSAEPRGTASNPDSREQAAGERPTDEKTGKKDVTPDAAKKLKKP